MKRDMEVDSPAGRDASCSGVGGVVVVPLVAFLLVLLLFLLACEAFLACEVCFFFLWLDFFFPMFTYDSLFSCRCYCCNKDWLPCQE